MSQGWSKLLDVGPLADGREEFNFSIPLTEFPRVLPQLVNPVGTATGRVSFSREGTLPVADVQVRASAQLTCQRCLKPVAWEVDSSGRAALVATAAEAERVPEWLETVLAADNRISIRDLVEEELLLSLPLVPRHAALECAGDAAAAGAAVPEAGEPAETHRPFAQLSELFKRR